MSKYISNHNKLYRLLVTLSTGFLIVFLPLVVLSFRHAGPAEAGWIDDSWQYRKKITITNDATPRTDYQVSAVIDTATPIAAGQMRSDCGDIRLYTPTHTAISDYDIISCNSGQSVLAFNESYTAGETKWYWLYYGNPDAVSDRTSNRDTLYEFHDDFGGTTITPSTYTSGGGGTITQNDEIIITNNDNNWDEYFFRTATSTRTAGKTFYARLKADSGLPVMIGWHDSGTGASYTDLVYALYFNNGTLYLYEDGSSRTCPSCGTYTQGVYYDIKIELKSTGATYYVKAATATTWTQIYDSVYSSETPLHPGIAHCYTSLYSYSDDWIMYNDSAGAGLTVTSGTQESSPGPAAYWKFDEGTARSHAKSLTKNEQQLTILDRYIEFNNLLADGYLPADKSLGIVRWDADAYSDATVYLEADAKVNCCGEYRYIALYDTDGNKVSGSDVGTNSSAWTRIRSSAITLADDTDYTIRAYSNSGGSGYWGYVRAARLVVVQSGSSGISASQTQVEIGNPEKQTSDTATQLTDKKIWNYDSAKFNPVPTTYFEAGLRSSQPTIEQQITILDKSYSRPSSSTYGPTDNSLGIVHWDADKYPGATVYFEAMLNSTWDDNTYAALYATGGSQVSGSEITDSCQTCWQHNRSGAITLTDDTDYTIRVKTNVGYGDEIAYIRSARLIVIQSDTTRITGTQTQVEVGNTESQTGSSATELTDKKLYYYDSAKFTPVPTAYFEASVRNSNPTVEQQLNLLDQQYTTTSSSYSPGDNSLGIVRWDADRFPGATVYFEAMIYGGWDNQAKAALYTAGGSVVTDSEVTETCQTCWQYLRSSALTLTDDTDYVLRVRSPNGTNATVNAARLIVIQTNSTKITDTQTQVEVGNNETTIQTSYTNLTDKKIWNYDAGVYTPAPTAYFEATLSNDTAGQVAYAALYTDGASCSSVVSGSEVSVTGTTWTRTRSSSITLSDDTDYTVCVKAGANTARIASARVILDQTDAGGITALETVQQQINTAKTDADSTYTNQESRNYFNSGFEAVQQSFGGGTLTYYYEADIKTSAGTGYAQIYNVTGSSAITGSEVTTASTAYARVRSSAITSNLPQYPQDSARALDTQLKNSATNTTSVSKSWLVVRVSGLATSATTVYADLYNVTDSSQVSGSEVSGTSGVWSRVRSSAITLTSGKQYAVRLRSSAAGTAVYLENAKIILEQTDAGGITALETVQQHVNTVRTDADNTYTDQEQVSRFNPDLEVSQTSFSGATVAFFYEATMKTSAGTGYAQLRNDTLGSDISGSEVSTTSATYTRNRSADITANLPVWPFANNRPTQNLDTQLKNSATNTTSVSNSWIIAQVSNLATGQITAHADLYNLTDSVQVSGSEVSTTAVSWTRVRSNPITLTTGKDYVVRLKSSDGGTPAYLINAKVILDQSDSNGVKALETVQQQVNTASTDTDSTYTTQGFPNSYNAAGFNTFTNYNEGAVYFESTIKTSAGTGYAQLYGSSAITDSELTTTSTSYERKRSGDIYTNLPATATNLDTQLKNSASNTTTASNTWLVIQNSNTIPRATHDSTFNKIHLNLNNNPSWKTDADCVSGNCLSFDGVNDYGLVSDDGRLDFTASESFSVSLWMKSAQATGSSVLLAKYNAATGTDGGYKVVMESDGDITVGIDDDQTSYPEDSVTSTAASYDDNAWHHISAVKSATSSLSLYIDGLLIGTDASIQANGTLANTDSLYIGVDGNGTSTPYKGLLDEVKIYPYARSAAEIKTDYLTQTANRGSSAVLGAKDNIPLTDGLVLRYGLDESSADTCDGTGDACDSSGNNNHASWAGNATPVAGKFGNALSFDGSFDQASTAESTMIPVRPAAVDWYDTNWTNRKSITITNPTASAYTDFQVSHTVSYEADMQADFDDLRFTNAGNVPLDYWVETKVDGSTATVWVEVDSIPAVSDVDIYMYYGNEDAASESNGTDTFDFFDDFSGSSVDTDKWSGDTGNFTVSGGQLHGASTSYRIQSVPSFTGNYVQETRHYVTSEANNGHMSAGFFASTVDSLGVLYHPTNAWYYRTANSWGGSWSYTYTQWSRIKIVAAGNPSAIYNTGETSGTSNQTSINNNGLSAEKVALGYRYDDSQGGQAYDADWDWIFVRKYAGTDPTATFQAEETLFTKSVTFTAWIKADTLDSSQRMILARGSSPSFDWGIGASATSSGKLWYTADGEMNQGTSATTLTTGSWYQVALVSDGAKTQLYINGNYESETENSGLLPGNGTISVGAAANGSMGWDGSVDEVRIYNRALSPADIRGLYGWGTAPVAWWKLDEGSGQSVYDSSGNELTGTFGSAETGDSNDPVWQTGKFGKSVRFDGSDDYIQIEDNANLQVQQHTMMAWIKLENVSGDHAIIMKERSTFWDSYQFKVRDGQIRYCLEPSGGDVCLTASTVEADTWIHYAVTWDGSTMRVWKNGIQNSTTGTQTNLLDYSASDLLIGAEDQGSGPSTSFADGLIDEVKIYNYVRTPAQIIEDMNAGHPAPGSPVGSAVGHWPMDEGYGSTVHNEGSQGSSADGTLSGAPNPAWTNSGKFGKALSFASSGSDAVLLSHDVSVRGLSSYTLSAWVNITTMPPGANNSDIYAEATADDISKVRGMISVDNNYITCGTYVPGFHFRTGLGSSTRYDVCGSTTLSTGRWYHIVGVFDSVTDVHKVYLDGVVNGSLTQAVSAVADTASVAVPRIGIFPNDLSKVKGFVDEVKVFHNALTDDQVKLLYNNSKSAVLGALSDTSGVSGGSVASNSATAQYCAPGEVTGSCAPVGVWDFNEKSGTAAYDTSGYSNSGTGTNLKWRQGKFGSGLFSTNNNLREGVVITDPPSGILDFDNTRDFSFGTWLNLTSVDSTPYAIWKGGSSNSVAGYMLRLNSATDAHCRYTDGNASGTDDVSATVSDLSDGNWHFIECVMDRDGSQVGTAGFHMFVDGSLRASNTSLTEGSGVNSSDFLIGEINGTGQEFDGILDQVQVFPYARTPAQIAWEYTRGAPALWFDADECQGATLHDRAPKADPNTTGTDANVTIGVSGDNDAAGNCDSDVATEAWNNGTTGKRNFSLDLDGNDDYVTTSAFSPLAAAGQSVENVSWGGWFYPKIGIATKTLVEKAGEVRLQTDASGKPVCDIYTGGGFTSNTAAATNQALSLDTWSHVLCTYNGSAIKVYVNGLPADSWVQTGSITAASSILYIGENSAGSNRYQGQVDELQLYTYPLTLIQIKSLINQGSVFYGPATGAP